MINSINEQDLLNYASECGMINIGDIKDAMEKRRRKEIIAKHPYKIWLAPDGYWKSYLPNGDSKKLLKKKNEEDLIQTIIDFYEFGVESAYLFKNRYKDWIERQHICGRSDNTISKYESEYRRFFLNDQIEDMDIRKVDDIQISAFIGRVTQREKYQWRSIQGLFGYINGVMEKAVRDKLIDENPCKYVDLEMFKRYCNVGMKKTAKERVLSDEERKVLKRKMESSSNVACMAVELAMYTGMRVGELAGLKWEDIDYEHRMICICRSEKYNAKKKIYYIDLTKNHKIRYIPLTDGMMNVLQKIKKTEMKNGWLGEFVFQDDRGKIHKNRISSAARNNTMSLEFTNPKCVHAIRRTINSNMRCNGVSATVAASILGHSEKVNEMNYTYDVCNMEEKEKLLNTACSL